MTILVTFTKVGMFCINYNLDEICNPKHCHNEFEFYKFCLK
nr:MAG TPA: hypothetical protein [Caudoviricetes sp.]